MSLLVRPAREADLPEMSRVLIASITQLCAADHGDDANAIAAWTANKTPEMLGRMLVRHGDGMVVAERDGAVVAVGLSHADTIGLNYVDPAHRFTGASKALLAHMEAAIRARGHAVGRLASTSTARAFYRACGWVESAPGMPGNGFPMEKRL